MTRRVAPAALSLALLAACSGSHSPPPAGTVSAALFVNTNYAQYASGDPTAEASNARAALVGMKIPVEEFVGTSAAEIDQAVAGKSVLVFPDQENGSLALDLDPAAAAAIEEFVDGGGTLVVLGSNQAGLDLVNAIFGFHLTASSPSPVAVEPFSLVESAATTTPFAGGPATLLVGEEVDGVLEASLPAAARVIYEDASGDPGDPTASPAIPPTPAAAILTEIPFFSGRVVLVGYGFHDAKPVGFIDGGWLQVLETAVRL
ncbi:MAG TPA: hypothetical protein VML50_19130 [Anaeromyxobacter sp.]|nr:hypothetical protein [Anaeromyxobacter sp.]